MTARAETVARLRRERAPSWFPKRSAIALTAGGLASMVLLSSGSSGAFGTQRLDNLWRFLREDALPAPLRAGDSPAALGTWIGEWWQNGAGAAALSTFAMASVAMLIASALGALLAILGSRELAQGEPFVSVAGAARPGIASLAVRAFSLLARAVPEYILAYLLLALFGANAWPAVLALGLHNAGILGRLGGEVIEDLERRPLNSLTLGGTRTSSLIVVGVLPAAFGRYLLFVLYRFETCLREATVLGMIGIVSLGSAVQEARARQRYDELVLLLALAGLLVVAVDLTSRRLRRWLRSEPT